MSGASAYGTMRSSPQRRLIAEAAAEMSGAFTVDALVRAVRERSAGVGVATVYRAVSALESSGFLEQVGSKEGKALYAHCPSGHHHHHLVCTRCGTTLECACPIDSSVRETAEAAGFALTGHEITLYGLCACCRIRAEA